MASHIKIVGVLHIVLGSLSILAGVIVLFIFGGLAGMAGMNLDADARAALPFLGGLGVIIAAVLFIVGIPGIIAGIGLVQFRPWGRILGIVISALDLLHVPFGTALGVYGLWALLSPEGERLFQNPPGQPMRAI
jgi:hypothetical protein